MLTCELKGNLGNHLFQMWSLVGLSIKHDHTGFLPEHPIFDFVNVSSRNICDASAEDILTPEKTYEYHEWPIADKTKNYCLYGYRQSEKYWSHCEKELREMFKFKESFIQICENKVDAHNIPRTQRPAFLNCDKEIICISIRRGDFVGNKTYYQLPITYYIGALFKHFPDFQKNYNLLILSDDMEYCRVHFECLPNAYFADGCNAIEQLCLGSMCDHHIISNSTFSWWCAYLADAGKVIRPLYNFGDDYRKANPEHDYWPDRDNWIIFEHEGYKIPLPDVTFMIPVYYDHPDRKQNLNLSVCMLQRDFDLQKDQIIVMENDSAKFTNQEAHCKYIRSAHRYFHRTRMLNDMAKMATTSIIVNWDADVFIAPLQVWLSVDYLEYYGADFVYPYDGRFARVTRKDGMESDWYKALCKHLDVGIFRNITHFGKKGKEMATSSVGGAVVMSKQAFIQAGMENEHMISYAPEDCERWDRWHKLDFEVRRVTGKLYHMDHFCGATSSSKNPFFVSNHAELDKIRAMSEKDLQAYVRTWPWAKNILSEKKETLP